MIFTLTTPYRLKLWILEDGTVYGHVYDAKDGTSIAAWSEDEAREAGAFPPVAAGWMKNLDDMDGLCHMLDIEGCEVVA